ncbi:MAG TPA: DinB family protein [Terriglobales bacterium]|jgi:uncharacterized damage-inducible protein DinB|nr:DinB family protein [Terriglobales bacterium]
MGGIKHFQRLFKYDDWANRQVLGLLPIAPARSLELLAHIFSAERLWWERLHQRTQSFPVWPNFPLKQCAQQAEEVPLLWREFFNSQPDLDQVISYKNTIGESFSSRIEDIVMHVYTHSAYHRGQIAVDIRESGGTPLNTDLIHCVRQGFVE